MCHVYMLNKDIYIWYIFLQWGNNHPYILMQRFIHILYQQVQYILSMKYDNLNKLFLINNNGSYN